MALVRDHSPVENDLETLHLPKTGLRQRIMQMEETRQPAANRDRRGGPRWEIHGYVSRRVRQKRGRASSSSSIALSDIPTFTRRCWWHSKRSPPTRSQPTLFSGGSRCDRCEHPPYQNRVKFENEQALWQILMVTVKEALGRSTRSIHDFDTDDVPEIHLRSSAPPRCPG